MTTLADATTLIDAVEYAAVARGDFLAARTALKNVLMETARLREALESAKAMRDLLERRFDGTLDDFELWSFLRALDEALLHIDSAEDVS